MSLFFRDNIFTAVLELTKHSKSKSSLSHHCTFTLARLRAMDRLYLFSVHHGSDIFWVEDSNGMYQGSRFDVSFTSGI